MSHPAHHAVRIPATTANLGPGFDAFGAAVGLHLHARSTDRTDDGRVELSGEGADELETGDGNLVWRAFVAFCEHRGVVVPDVGVRVHNGIPMARGVGSSSAAIVAGLVLARAVTGQDCSDEEVVRFADQLEGHPDNVAPAVLGGIVAAASTDEGLVLRRAQPHAALRPAILVPDQRQLTADARTVLPAALDRADVAVQAARAGHVLAGLLGMWPVAPGAAGDRLHEPPRLAAMSRSGRVVDRLRTGGIHAWLSGAGPSVAAALSGDPGEEQRLRSVAGDEGFRVYLPGWDLSGAFACPVETARCAYSRAGRCVRCPAHAV